MKTYIVFDLEWNQSPQGKEGSIENFPFEIIEIGAVKVVGGVITLTSIILPEFSFGKKEEPAVVEKKEEV